MALIATKQKGNVEKALNNFMEMASDEVSKYTIFIIYSLTYPTIDVIIAK